MLDAWIPQYFKRYGYLNCPEYDENVLPAVPENLRAAVKKDGVNLTWNEVEDADGYEILRAAEACGSFKAVADVEGGCRYVDSHAGGEAFYCVRAYRYDETRIRVFSEPAQSGAIPSWQ